MTNFLHQLARAAGTPKTATSICLFNNRDVGTMYDGPLLHSPTRTTVMKILDTKLHGEVELLKRETSTPKNAMAIISLGHSEGGNSLIIEGIQEAGMTSFAHLRGDAMGNFVSDQRHRGGIAG